jgi:hypothetical protein
LSAFIVARHFVDRVVLIVGLRQRSAVAERQHVGRPERVIGRSVDQTRGRRADFVGRVAVGDLPLDRHVAATVVAVRRATRSISHRGQAAHRRGRRTAGRCISLIAGVGDVEACGIGLGATVNTLATICEQLSGDAPEVAAEPRDPCSIE